MHVECYDSPFHRVVESPTDRLIQEVKKRFCEFLRDALSKIKDIEIVEMSHPMMSCYISVLLKWSSYEIRVNYDMDKKQFAEPMVYFRGRTFMRDGYLFTKEEMGVKMITIFANFYEVSKLEGCGTRHGGNWDNKDNSNLFARKEYERLREEYRKYMVKQQEEREIHSTRCAEFARKMEEPRKQESVEVYGQQIESRDKNPK